MTKLITGRFDDAEQVQRALTAIREAGFEKGQYGIFYVTPPGQHASFPIGGDAYRSAGTEDSGPGAAAGAAIGGGAGLAMGAVAALAFPVAGLAALLAGTGVGAYVGSLVGAMSQSEHPAQEDVSEEHPAEQPGGVRMAVNVDAGGGDKARQALESAGAKDIIHAEGEWREGEWKDFDPTASENTATPPASDR